MDAGRMSIQGKRLLITGAGGFCGEHACRYFAAQGMQVTAVVRKRYPSQARVEDSYRLAWPSSVEGRLCELTDRGQVQKLVNSVKPDYVLHLAGLNAVGPSWEMPLNFLETNAMATAYLLEAIRIAGCSSRVLVAGSMLGFKLPRSNRAPKPAHPYGMSKTLQALLAQCWGELYGIEVMVGVPSNLVGPGRSTGLYSLLADYAIACERSHLAGDRPPAPFRLSSRSERRDFLDVRDAMAAYETMMEKGAPGGVYPIASGKLVTLGETADLFAELSLSPLQFEVGDSKAPSPAPADPSQLQALGWRPRIKLKDTVRDLLLHRRLQSMA